MRYLHWILRILLFVLLLGFAIKNTDPVVVRYFLGWEWHASLSLVLLVFFVAGAGLGVLAGATWAYHQRRELLQLRRELRARQPAAEPADRAPERRLL
jgi:putative membrane protein